jgi:hypothetical protein
VKCCNKDGANVCSSCLLVSFAIGEGPVLAQYAHDSSHSLPPRPIGTFALSLLHACTSVCSLFTLPRLPCSVPLASPPSCCRHRYAGGDTSDCDSQDGDDTQQQQQRGPQQQRSEGDVATASAAAAVGAVRCPDESDLDDAAVCTSMDEDELQHQLGR